ncbi:serine/threonine protein kinase [Salmonella enterica subsp. diarizonae]|jgi:serine/threonine-protein kinase|nr:serine/threonine protein kinase [Salmonella enterica]EBV2374056.1 serine/threonine protein kinase [Salmonella enterica subsp. enterica serovar Enteritidis]ECC9190719.1 serine/threonine protein kinase [Salmonella enterica subsp. diarizonae]EGL0766048.1 protein kinase [Salmonella enterica subsp. enterica]EBE1333401.1 serine/threonine protein kinase [Salmonella enterica]
MPDLDSHMIGDLSARLERVISLKTGYHSPVFLAAGGSAAVFKVETPLGPRAYKVFDPKFINEEENSKERYRLSLQERLIGHSCETLVQTYNISLAEDTAFVEMEYIEWPQLKKIIRDVPDNVIQSLILQLIEAVKYLESVSIVHRDIKPENIHVSPDFTRLKLLDLGVVREFDPDPGVEETDHGNLRLFLATAQYSAPEYLFRLDAPSKDLWRALNLYQVGAVLHDLIMKEAIFQAEINTGNRWLVAKAVLLKHPQFIDGNPERLIRLKSVASKCLTKEMDIRLKIVSWDDFSIVAKDPLINLRERLSSRNISSEANLEREINFYREAFKDEISAKIRERLIPTCKTDLPFTLSSSTENKKTIIELKFSIEKSIGLLAHITLDWQDGLYKKNGSILMSCCLIHSDKEVDIDRGVKKIICTYSTDVNIDEVSYLICNVIADAIVCAFDLVAATDTGSISCLNNFDLMTSN